MSEFSQSDLGFIKAMARELIVSDNKKYQVLTLAIDEAENFLKLFNTRYATSHTRADNHAKSECQ